MRDKLATWTGGRLVVHITEMPIKCPVAPLEFAFLAEAFFAVKGIRDAVDITYGTPLEVHSPSRSRLGISARCWPTARSCSRATSPSITSIRRRKCSSRSASARSRSTCWSPCPSTRAADFLARSGLGNELNYLPVDKHTLLSTNYPNIFSFGDASDIPASKGRLGCALLGRPVHRELPRAHRRPPMTHPFDGHANCFIESGHDKAMLIDQIVAAGGHLWGCRMSADMNKLTMDDLRDNVEGIISASNFTDKTAGAQLLLI